MLPYRLYTELPCVRQGDKKTGEGEQQLMGLRVHPAVMLMFGAGRCSNALLMCMLSMCANNAGYAAADSAYDEGHKA